MSKQNFQNSVPSSARRPSRTVSSASDATGRPEVIGARSTDRSGVPVTGPPGTGPGSNRRMPGSIQPRGRSYTVENAVNPATAANSGPIVIAGAGYAGLHVA